MTKIQANKSWTPNICSSYLYHCSFTTAIFRTCIIDLPRPNGISAESYSWNLLIIFYCFSTTKDHTYDSFVNHCYCFYFRGKVWKTDLPPVIVYFRIWAHFSMFIVMSHGRTILWSDPICLENVYKTEHNKLHTR